MKINQTKKKQITVSVFLAVEGYNQKLCNVGEYISYKQDIKSEFGKLKDTRILIKPSFILMPSYHDHRQHMVYCWLA